MAVGAGRPLDEPREEQILSPDGCLERGRLTAAEARSAVVANEVVDGLGERTGRGMRDSLIAREARGR